MADFVISVSYGNYLIQNGGTDKVIREHQEMFAREGVSYLFLFPVIRTIQIGGKRITLRWWGMDLDREFLGLFHADDVLAYISELTSGGGRCRGIFIHHLWRVETEELTRVLQCVQAPICCYLHDFYMICDGKNLISQQGRYCGFGADRPVCDKACAYRQQSEANRQRLLRLIETFEDRIQFVAPCDNTRDIYRSAFPDHAGKFISIPHQTGEGSYQPPRPERPIRVAFIGKQTDIKGWHDYKQITQALAGKTDYEFYYFGTPAERPPQISAFIGVSVKDQGPDAMLNALRENRIQAVMLLSGCPETYSYTYFEAYAAGCYVIAYPCSGNIADMIGKNGNGAVVADAKEAAGLLADEAAFWDRIVRFHASQAHIPQRLVPNQDIIRRTLAFPGCAVSGERAGRHGRMCRGFTALYRLQNRQTLRALQE